MYIMVYLASDYLEILPLLVTLIRIQAGIPSFNPRSLTATNGSSLSIGACRLYAFS